MISFVGLKLKTILLALVLLAALSASCQAAASPDEPQTLISLDPNTSYQAITGWEATASVGQLDFPSEFLSWTSQIINASVNDLGINRLRMAIRSGAENPRDYFSPYATGQAPRSSWKPHWYTPINDNSDPFSINWDGFQFSELDLTVENVVLPIKQELEANGESLYLNLNYVDFDSSSFEHYSNPEEYAELMLATFIHMRDKYGFVPDAIEIILEPDNSAGWSGRQIGEVLVATAERLEDEGFAVPDFIAPSTKSMKEAQSYFDDMIEVDGVLDHLTEIAYHRYSGVSDRNLQAIADRAVKYNLNTSMLEKIKSDYEDLHKDLKVGRNSAWQQYSLAFPGKDNAAHYYRIDLSDQGNPKVKMGQRTGFLRQYFKFIRSGAVRIEAATTNDDFDPLAFINESGAYVVAVKANRGEDFTIQGLPAGTYGISYTTPQSYAVDLDDVSVTDSTLTTSIPSEGVITIYGKQGP